MSELSLLFALSSGLMAAIPLGQIVSPMRLGALAWSVLWLLNYLFGSGFTQSNSVLVFVFVCNTLAWLGGLMVVRTTHSAGLSVDKERFVGRLGIGSPFRVRANWLILVAGFGALDFGIRQMGRSGGFVSFLSSGQGEVFEALRLGKASFSATGEWEIPSGITLATLLMCTSAVLTGFELANADSLASKRARIFQSLSFGAFAFALSFGTGMRALLIAAGFLFLGSWLAVMVHQRGGKGVITLRMFTYLLAICVAFFAWLVIVQSARRQDYSLQNLSATLDYLKPWFAGYLPALSEWYAQDPGQLGQTGGMRTARAILGPLGLAEGEGFSEQLGLVHIGNGSTSNAMTIYRALWEDYGIALTALICLVCGVVAQMVYAACLSRGGNWIVPMAAVYAATLYSVNYWFFGYGSRFFGVILAFGIVYWSLLPLRRGPDISPSGWAVRRRQSATHRQSAAS